MKLETLNRLLNTAIEIITELEGQIILEGSAISTDTQVKLDAMLEEIKYSNDIEDEVNIVESHTCPECGHIMSINTKSDGSSGWLCINCGYFPESTYVLIRWPESQELMDKEWFNECVLAENIDGHLYVGSSAYFVPVDRIKEMEDTSHLLNE